MLVVGDILQSEEQLDQLPKPTPEEVTWPDGLTAVMRNVRQERWRQKIDLGVSAGQRRRMHRRLTRGLQSDATVVDAVERLMRLDASALSVSNSEYQPIRRPCSRPTSSCPQNLSLRPPSKSGAALSHSSPLRCRTTTTPLASPHLRLQHPHRPAPTAASTARARADASRLRATMLTRRATIACGSLL